MLETKLSTHPQFAVVGHPNKGKSSIVSALALDDSVHISTIPGTTHKQRHFPLSIDGKILYELIDTPGFQRARGVLAWLQTHEVSADKRHEVVKAFIEEHRDDHKFHDEIELLTPIVAGAGVIYVVDASRPYGDEYEAEMEILRWSGQASMALINHIGEDDYTQEWKHALGQYFKMVRSFNPMTITLNQHIGILESMAQLKEEWIEPVKKAIEVFRDYHGQKVLQSSEMIMTLLIEAVTLVESCILNGIEATDEDKEKVEKKYKTSLRTLEDKHQVQIEKLWHHHSFEKEQKYLTFEDLDLFSEASASLFGLTKKELMLTAVTSGAVTGAGIDLVFAGHTLLLGGAIGALVGGIGAYFSFDELSDIRVLGQRLGKQHLEIGPMKNRNFPYILLGRAIYHTIEVISSSHAKRERVDLSDKERLHAEYLNDTMKKTLEKSHKLFRSQKEIEKEDKQAYTVVIEEILRSLIK